MAWFLAAVLMLGIGFRFHASLNAAPMFLRFTQPDDLENLMPRFSGSASPSS